MKPNSLYKSSCVTRSQLRSKGRRRIGLHSMRVLRPPMKSSLRLSSLLHFWRMAATLCQKPPCQLQTFNMYCGASLSHAPKTYSLRLRPFIQIARRVEAPKKEKKKRLRQVSRQNQVATTRCVECHTERESERESEREREREEKLRGCLSLFLFLLRLKIFFAASCNSLALEFTFEQRRGKTTEVRRNKGPTSFLCVLHMSLCCVCVCKFVWEAPDRESGNNNTNTDQSQCKSLKMHATHATRSPTLLSPREETTKGNRRESNFRKHMLFVVVPSIRRVLHTCLMSGVNACVCVCVCAIYSMKFYFWSTRYTRIDGRWL